jgi:hypothetical protein
VHTLTASKKYDDTGSGGGGLTTFHDLNAVDSKFFLSLITGFFTYPCISLLLNVTRSMASNSGPGTLPSALLLRVLGPVLPMWEPDEMEK